ncbi:cilia- and flagella-associated protein 206-like [Copidosoma floridanum]|uniref:cilia- and flagella-associated protein 206-like n=1 Tax=Copidosoma floridanum TaxID=29053 RepID=UPI000C6F54D0|nr:cilia- and flagella-associated protein 206-like [Copidosoma floridanum]
MDTPFNDMIEEITKQCSDKGIQASPDFVVFLVSLVSLSLTNRGYETEGPDSNETKILNGVIEKLFDPSRPSFVALKLQFHFAKRYRDRGHAVKKCRSRLAHKTAPLSKEICDTVKLDSTREMERLYQKILVFITLLSGLGDPTLPPVLREVAIGLQSVIQPSELPRFVALSEPEKEEQLAELALIVAGIRLFNRDRQSGGEGIDDRKNTITFLGFCAWSFVVGRGALIPGNPNIGVAEWRGKCFVFSSVEAAKEFGEQPDRFFSLALDIVRKKQEYIYLFQMFNDLQSTNSYKSSSDEGPYFLVRQHQEVQTDTHVVPTFIDKDYSASLWQLREQALHLADICRSVTRSTQTFKSHFRAGVNLQTLMPKDKEAQTRKDSSTNTITAKKYLFGSRGRPNLEELVNCGCNNE